MLDFHCRMFLTVLVLTMAAPIAVGQDASKRPLRIVVPYAAGGTTDQVARLLQKPLGEALQQTVIVENKPGATGTIGTEMVAHAVPDGNTIVFGNPAPNAIIPALRKTAYDPVLDLRPISTVAVMPMFLVVPVDSGIGSLKEFLRRARGNGQPMNYGSSGVGSISHLTGAHFARLAGLEMTHVPYQGGFPVMTAMLQGDLQATFVTGLDGAAMVQSGKAKYLAIGSAKRSGQLPNMPAIAEEIPGFQSVVWFALFAPKGTPDVIVERLRGALLTALERPEIRKFLTDRNAEAKGCTTQELTQMIVGDMKQWGDVARMAGIQM